MLANVYAQALHNALKSATSQRQVDLVANLSKLLKRRGHIKLMPAIVRECEKLAVQTQEADRGVLEVAEKRETLSGQVKEACAQLELNPERLNVQENPHLIGGFLLRKQASQIDASYRRRLVELYRRLITA